MLNSQGLKGHQTQTAVDNKNQISAPAISLPKGGGAIRGIGEKFAANPVTGTGSMTVPIAASPGRSGFSPQLSLSYDSGSGNGPFGFGWSLSLPAITRKTDKGLPQYRDGDESDVYILSGAEDLAPVLKADGKRFKDDTTAPGYIIHRYRPRIEGLFARIERWTNIKTGEIHWRSISRDNITTLYGKDNHSRIFDPAELDKVDPTDPDKVHPTRIFSWLICQSYDDKGNASIYEYAAENDDNIDGTQANERNRVRTANRYLKRIKYGNRTPNRDATTWQATDPAQLPDDTWMFEVVFDYGEGHYTEDSRDDQGSIFAQAQIAPPAGSRWPVRQDPFSTYRAGFEVRTYRLCRRVLMFHHFPQELGIADCLVHSTEFSYSESPIASFITGVTQSGYVRQPVQNQPDPYLKKSLPSLEFEYSQVPSPEQLVQQPIRDVDTESLENLPVGLDGASYQWMDLDGEGTSGILTEQADGWYYKRNLSASNQVPEGGHEHTVARFGPAELIASKPAVGLAGGAQFLDLAGDGQVDLVQMEGPVRGFYERTEDANWEPLQPFVSWPDLDTRDPDLKFVDLTGDGHADILITEGEALTWYPSLAEEGFGPAVRVSLPADEEKGPRLVFADGTQSIYLADLSGGGLSDLVRIRNGEVCYWPNLGYGHFGAKVTMDNAPWFESPDQFDQRRIRLADTDGSGTTDILYLRRDGVQIYFNQSGNRWSDAVALPQFPPIDNISAVQALDLLGNGTACLVWSSPLPGDTRQPMRYLALMEEKPHLLVGVKNNLGAETKVYYAPSTRFYLDDKRDGKPWTTRLPFPVHVVERVETYDYISRNRFVTRYAYHHGYYDGVEREFRGFGMVEQWDTEEIGTVAPATTTEEDTNWDAASFVPPVLTRTWFHTGVYIEGGRISKQFEHEYYREGDVSRGEAGLTDPQLEAMLLADTVLPDTLRLPDGIRAPYSLSGDEAREACRSLKGAILRQEIYGLDPTDEADRPYSVSERNYTIELLQPQGQNRHAVFFTHARETVDFHYERQLFKVAGGVLVDPQAPPPDARDAADPRVTHALTLAVDNYGNVLQSVAIGYGRRFKDQSLSADDQTRQASTLVTCTENVYTNAVLEGDAYRAPLLCEARTYEVLNLALDPSEILPNITNLFRFDEVAKQIEKAGDGNHDLPYEDINHTQATTSDPYRRLIEHVRTLYRKNDLTGFSPFGKVESLALPGESYKLAFTPGLLAQVFRRNGQALLPNPADVLGGQGADRGGYVDLDGNGHWWIPSGRVFYSPPPNDPPASELAFARAHFFLPHRYRDPFGNEVIATYDSDAATPARNHNLLLVETKDPLGNVATVRTEDDNGAIEIRNNYRVLQPYWLTDPNGNRTQVAFDALGLVVATAVMGKPGENKGDLMDGAFVPDLDLADIQGFAKDPRATAKDLLKSATTRVIYDLDRYQRCGQPPFAATLAREIHAHDLNGGPSPIQLSFTYSDGFGREIQAKIQAEPGDAPQRDPDVLLSTGDIRPGDLVRDASGKPVQASAAHRWVGKGRTVYNNKGKPVKQYEPFFSSTHLYEPERDMTDTGVTPVLFYDPVERVTATLHPNNTWEKVVFDPWRQAAWDVNDTVLVADPRADPDVGDFFKRLLKSDPFISWHDARKDGQLGAAEQQAAQKAAVHANTPAITHLDTLGRVFLSLAHNRFLRIGAVIEEQYATRTQTDIEGNQRQVIDARDRVVMRYDYDMLSNRIHQASMEAGERWMLNDVTGKPIRAWDSRGFTRRMVYDVLRRPTELSASDRSGNRWLAERTVYGEGQGDAGNHRGRVYQVFDSAGVVTSESYDFKGNLLRSTRQLVADYQHPPDWGASPQPGLEAEKFIGGTTHDALNRPIQLLAPYSDQPSPRRINVIRPGYNEANLLERIDIWLEQASEPASLLDPATARLHSVKDIDYNAKGQRERIEYGNDVVTTYAYDEKTFRLTHIKTTRPAGLDGLAAQLFANPAIVQDLRYTYDPVGNITNIADNAIPAIQYNNQNAEPNADYIYDAIYRLISADGREHIGQTAFDFNPLDGNYRDYPFVGLRPSANDPNALRNYTETYEYDEVGNIKNVRHSALNGSWTRGYQYDAWSLLEPGSKRNNRLTSTKVGNGINFTETYGYADAQGNDVHGCMTSINSMGMTWDFKDQLQSVNLGGGGTAYYVYDAAGQRVRKVIHRQNGTKQKERIYLGGFEIYREYDGSGGATPKLERETLHVMDDKQRIALVETRTQGNEPRVPRQLVRYQFSNHLGSAILELNELAGVVSYEEYHPYGTSSYQAVRTDIEVPAKRYRYTGKERNEETGLYYHGARYYAPWLGRWMSCDPKGIRESRNLYEYVADAPITYTDPTGGGRKPIHFWTTLLVAYAAGNNHENAIRLAMGAQLPDTIKQLDAMAQFKSAMWENWSSGEAGAHQRTVYDAAHALPNYSSSGVQFTSSEERQITRNMLTNSFNQNSLEFFITSHRYGDTYFHSTSKTGVDVPIDRGLFNTGHNLPNTLGPIIDVDRAGRDNRQEQYGLALYDVLIEKNSAKPKLTREQLSTILKDFKRTMGSKSDLEQEDYLYARIEQLFFADPESLKGLGPDQALQQVKARELLIEAMNLPEDAISTDEFQKKFPQLSGLMGDISPQRIDQALKNVANRVEEERNWIVTPGKNSQ